MVELGPAASKVAKSAVKLLRSWRCEGDDSNGNLPRLGGARANFCSGLVRRELTVSPSSGGAATCSGIRSVGFSGEALVPSSHLGSSRRRSRVYCRGTPGRVGCGIRDGWSKPFASSVLGSTRAAVRLSLWYATGGAMESTADGF